jgi:predicted DNA-binding ribbon-helix-helix protein
MLIGKIEARDKMSFSLKSEDRGFCMCWLKYRLQSAISVVGRIYVISVIFLMPSAM